MSRQDSFRASVAPLAITGAPVAVGAMTGSLVLVEVGAASFVLALVLSLRRPVHDG